MEIFVTFLSLFCVFFSSTSALTSKRTRDRLNYIEERLNAESSRLNAESKFRKEDFDVLLDKVEGIEKMLNKLLETKETDSAYSQISESVSDISDTKLNVLLKAFKTEKFENKRFKREILQDVNKDAELTKEAFGRVENRLDYITKEIEQLKQETLQHQIGITKKVETIFKEQIKHESCLHLFNNGFRSDGIYKVQIGTSKTDVSVYCDMTTDGGGWTVFQRRQDGSEDFYRDWNDYKYGFGKLDGEFWLGNEYINILTDDGKTHEFRIDLEDYEGNKAYAQYNKFKIGPESTNYTLDVYGYTGNAGDSLLDVSNTHNGMQFTTKDRDNDYDNWNNCASYFNGAWWFNNCFYSHLNGIYNTQIECTSNRKCILWIRWKSNLHNIKFTEMKLR